MTIFCFYRPFFITFSTVSFVIIKTKHMIKRILLTFTLLFSVLIYAQKEMYELRVYELKFGKPENVLHDYFKNALMPALSRQGINDIGVFEELGETLPKKIYLFIPYKSMEVYQNTYEALKADTTFKNDSKVYDETEEQMFPYVRYTTSFFIAFEGLPKLVKPNNDDTVFELRIYEGYNEDAFQRKVKMFNKSEFKIFKDVGLRSVFFGEQISGPQMPNLTYMLAFKDMEDHDATWEKFGPNPEWQRIVKLPEYANTVSNIRRVFLRPLTYSKL